MYILGYLCYLLCLRGKRVLGCTVNSEREYSLEFLKLDCILSSISVVEVQVYAISLLYILTLIHTLISL